ncbi:DUF4349 domain-containing protein [Lentzea sp. NPDC042327]|uniref:DUF4349 domain-containing protein n=1 Tax=Lentzea sp. NPDC042327 TaxID=3154801 RepID=UPI0033D87E95
MSRRVLWVGVALLAVFATGCGADSKSSGGSSVAENAAPQQRAAQPTGAQKQQDNSGQQNQSAESVQQQERQLVRTATVDLRSDDVLRSISDIKAKAQQVGGFAGQESSTQSRGSVTVRVPSNELDGVVRSLEDYGDVTRSEVRSEDVTDQLVDVEARIATQKASVERLRVLFERAGSTAEIAQVEGELTKRQSELESLQRRSESLKGKAALATLTVQVSTTPIAPPAPERTGFGDAFVAGWNALVHVLRLVLVGVGGLLPFVLVLGVPTVAVIFWLRRRKRVTPTVEADA